MFKELAKVELILTMIHGIRMMVDCLLSYLIAGFNAFSDDTNSKKNLICVRHYLFYIGTLICEIIMCKRAKFRDQYL